MFKNMMLSKIFKSSNEEKLKRFVKKYQKISQRYGFAIVPRLSIKKNGKDVSDKELDLINRFLRKRNVAILPDLSIVNLKQENDDSGHTQQSQ